MTYGRLGRTREREREKARMMSDMITWLCATRHMWKSAKNDNSVRESDRRELTSLYRYVLRETEKEKLETLWANKLTQLHVSITAGKRLPCLNHLKTVIHFWSTLFFFGYSPRKKEDENSTDGDSRNIFSTFMQTHDDDDDDDDPILFVLDDNTAISLFRPLSNELFYDANERAFNQARIKRRWHEHVFPYSLSFLSYFYSTWKKKDDHHHSYVSKWREENKQWMNEWMNGSMAFFLLRLSLISFFQCVCVCVFASTNSRCIETHALTQIGEEK